MPMQVIHPQLLRIVHKFRPHDILHRGPILHPLHQRSQHISLSRKRDTCYRVPSALTDHPATWARITVEHPRYAEEAKEGVELARRGLHSLLQMCVEALRIETRDLVVLPTMVGDYLTAYVLELRQVGGPCADV